MTDVREVVARADAWRVKDFADGWILCDSKSEAEHVSREQSGALIEPLYSLSALAAAGYRIVPAVPTEAMVRAAMKSAEWPWPVEHEYRVRYSGFWEDGYRAMLAATKPEKG